MNPRKSLVIVALAAMLLGGCVPLVVGSAAVGTAMVVSDRRTSGSQLEDEGIEMRAANRIGELLGDSGHVSATSYNRTLLLTGEVPNAQLRQQIGDAAARIDNVRTVVNETVVDFPASITQRSADTLTTGRVKAALVDTRNIQSRAIKVLTDRGVVYLMGIVTQREADIAAEVARNVGGVQKVVRVLEVVSENELARARAAGSGTTPVAAPAPAASPLPPPAPVPLPSQPAPVQTMPVR